MASPELIFGSEYTKSHPNSFEKIPRGDGHTVILIEGLYETPKNMEVLATRLNQVGYNPIPSGMDRNLGHKSQQYKVMELVENIVAKEGEVFIVGHSLGGRMAIEATRNPGVKKVVTMGSPVFDLRIPADTQVLCLFGTYDLVVPFPFSTNPGETVQTQAVFSGHLELVNSSFAFEKAGQFFAS